MNTRLRAVLDKLRYANLPTFMDVEITGPNTKGRSFGDTPLHIVAVWGDTESASVLIEEGAEIDVRGEDEYTPLHNAIEQSRFDVVRLLLEAGANPFLKTRNGADALELAVLSGHDEILKLLTDRIERCHSPEVLKTSPRSEPHLPTLFCQQTRLPESMLIGADCSSNEVAWKVEDFPRILDLATEHRLACIGGQFQLRGPLGTAEMYWHNVESNQQLPQEEWDQFVTRANREVRDAFDKTYSNTVFDAEAMGWDHIRDAADSGSVGDPKEHLYIVAHFADGPTRLKD